MSMKELKLVLNVRIYLLTHIILCVFFSNIVPIVSLNVLYENKHEYRCSCNIIIITK